MNKIKYIEGFLVLISVLKENATPCLLNICRGEELLFNDG